MNCELDRFFQQQLSVWELAQNNYSDLQKVQTKTFEFDQFDIAVQFNPARMISSAAKTDAKSIAERKCFLCAANRPEVQCGIAWRDYDILVNPYPIFSQHYVIAHHNHTPQIVMPYIGDMVQLAKQLTDYALFYNGAECGASAPDHMHFQACKSDCLPLISDYFRLKELGRIEYIWSGKENKAYVIKDYLRTVYCIEGVDDGSLIFDFVAFVRWFQVVHSIEPFAGELKMNLVCYYRNDRWYLFVIPRKTYRPWQYDAEDATKRLLISPGTVEMCGIFITPVEEHFHRITKDDVIDIFNQASHY